MQPPGFRPGWQLQACKMQSSLLIACVAKRKVRGLMQSKQGLSFKLTRRLMTQG